MTDILIIALVALILGLAGYYIYGQKKKGSPCIGCPYSGSCGGSCGGCGKNSSPNP